MRLGQGERGDIIPSGQPVEEGSSHVIVVLTLSGRRQANFALQPLSFK